MTEPPDIVAQRPCCHHDALHGMKKIRASRARPCCCEAGLGGLIDHIVGTASLIRSFGDGEVAVEISENVRGMDCFVLQSISAPANLHLMELLIMVDALKRSSARLSRYLRKNRPGK